MAKFKTSTKNNMKFIDSEQLYDHFVDKKALLVQIHDVVDFDYYRQFVDHLYSEHGRSAYDCMLMFKLCLLQYLKNGLSDREVIAQAKTNLEYRYFLDLAVDDPLPDASKLCTFRTRLGEEQFKELFEQFVNTLKEQQVITDDDVRFMDATHQIADVTRVSINTLLAQACKHVRKELQNARAPVTKPTVDLDEKDFLLNEQEQKNRFVKLVELAQELKTTTNKTLEHTPSPELETAQTMLNRIVKERAKTHDDGTIERQNSKDTGRLASTTDPDATWGAKSKDRQFLGYKHNATATSGGFIEVISTHLGHKGDEEFYLEDAKKSSGKKMVADSKYGTQDNREQSKALDIQLVAPCRKNMKAHLRSQIMEDAFQYNQTTQYKQEMKQRGSLIEGLFGVMKRAHSFTRAKFRSIHKVAIQGLLTAYVMNLKALVTWYQNG